MPRRVSDFLTPQGFKAARRGSLSLRGRDSSGRFCKTTSRKAVSVELVQNNKSVHRFKAATVQRQLRGERLVTKSLPSSVSKALKVLAPGAKVYRSHGMDLVSTLPSKILKTQLAKNPDLVRLVYIKDGRRRSFIITAKTGWQSRYGSRRIKRFGKDWRERVEHFTADFLKRFQKSAPESDIQIIGAEPIWSDLESD